MKWWAEKQSDYRIIESDTGEGGIYYTPMKCSAVVKLALKVMSPKDLRAAILNIKDDEVKLWHLQALDEQLNISPA